MHRDDDSAPASWQAFEQAARAAGFLVRGGFHPQPGDRVPPLTDGTAPATVVLLGNAGPAMWNAFQATGESSLDDWTRRVVDGIAAALGARPVYPFTGPPFLPFQRWAQRAEAVAPSPLGLLVHPDYGLWHAYRAALLVAYRVELPAADTRPPPCRSCTERPCLSGCPVGAFGDGGYDVARCVSHLAGEAGPACMSRGCLARRACPVGADCRYSPEQAAFHMRAFFTQQGS